VNYFQLVLKQMRQRALSTWLTTLSVMLGVGLAIAIMVLGRESGELFGQNSYGYDAIVGMKGSKLQLVLNTVYHLDVSPGNIPFSEYTRLLPPPPGVPPEPDSFAKYVKIAVPTVVGDTLGGIYRIVGTTPQFFGYDDSGNQLPPDQGLDYRPGMPLQIEQGRVFAGNKFEAVVGSDIPLLTGKGMGSEFQATHGSAAPGQPADVHAQVWHVVGILAPTHTAIDRALYIPLLSFYTISAHGPGLAAHAQLRNGKAPTAQVAEDENPNPPADAKGIQHFKFYDFDTTAQTFHLKIPPEQWEVSAILVQSRGGFTENRLEYELPYASPEVMAVNPATVMREFFQTFLTPSRKLLLLICSLVTIVAAVGILVSIYNSVSARLREIAILRALGATRGTILTLICLEAGLIALIGSVLGLVVGHAVSAAGSWYMNRTFGQPLNWMRVDYLEILYIVGVILLAVLAGLVPAIKAYRTPVATNLVAA
jgi:putative ABC transport system permease protein